MAKYFDPEQDAEIVKETYNTVKVKVVTTVNGKEFAEKFGFDRRQYPDGSWDKHVDMTIEKAKKNGISLSNDSSSNSKQ